MFTPFKLYAHNRMLDAAVYVLKAHRLDDGSYNLKVRWMLRSGADLQLTEMVTITRKELKNWVLIA